MRRTTSIVAIALLVLSGSAFADRKVKDYAETIDMFKGSATVAPFFESAYGYATFPTIGKGGFGIGGAHGKGQVYRAGKVTGFDALSGDRRTLWCSAFARR